MFAATVAGIYPDVLAAQKAMSAGFEKTYKPNPASAKRYDAVYAKYLALGGFIEKELTK